jgi:hypothetical protein
MQNHDLRDSVCDVIFCFEIGSMTDEETLSPAESSAHDGLEEAEP